MMFFCRNNKIMPIYFTAADFDKAIRVRRKA